MESPELQVSLQMPIMNNGTGNSVGNSADALPKAENKVKAAKLKLIALSLAFLIPAAVIVANAGDDEIQERRITVYDGGGIAKLAERYLGVPYKPGGHSPAGFDCSGLTSFVYDEAGYSIPRSASAQYSALRPVRVPEVGDLVFFRTMGNSVSHVGIYIGNYKFIHAPSSGKTVSIADMRIQYWKSSYAGARTIFQKIDESVFQ